MSWSSIYGHDKQKHFFQRILQSQSLSHAYLFTGPAQVGKETFALEIARCLNCLSPTEDGSCEECQNCHLIQAHSHPDVLFLSPHDGKILIEDVRDFIFQLGLEKTLGKYRVGIIQSAELISKEEIQNCLLKSIEEPPENCILILVTSQVHALLPTILSRCQRIPFQRLRRDDIQRYLVNELQVSSEEAWSIADQSQGSIGRARALFEGNQSMLDKALFLWNHLLSGQEIFSLGQWFVENKDQLLEIFLQLEWYLRDVFMYKLNGMKGKDYFSFNGQIHRIQSDSQRLTRMIISCLLQLIEQLTKDVKNNVNVDIAAFHFLLQIREELNGAPSSRNKIRS